MLIRNYYLTEEGRLFYCCNGQFEEFVFDRYKPYDAPKHFLEGVKFQRFQERDDATQAYIDILTDHKLEDYRWIVFFDEKIKKSVFLDFLKEIGVNEEPLMAQLVELEKPVYFGLGEAVLSVDGDGDSCGRSYLLRWETVLEIQKHLSEALSLKINLVREDGYGINSVTFAPRNALPLGLPSKQYRQNMYEGYREMGFQEDFANLLLFDIEMNYPSEPVMSLAEDKHA